MNIFDELKQYMLIDTRNCLKNDFLNCKNINNKGTKKEFLFKTNDDFFIPSEGDTLFWCFYIIDKGFISYELLGKINLIKESSEKINYVEVLRKNKHILKTAKIKNLTNIENELVNDKNITIKFLIAMSHILNINIIIVRNNTYFETNDSVNKQETDDIDDREDTNDTIETTDANDNNANITNNVFLINCIDNNFGLLKCHDNSKKYQIIKNKYKLDNYELKLKSISSYKLNELIEISKKMNIHIGENDKKTKKDLYEMINTKLKE